VSGYQPHTTAALYSQTIGYHDPKNIWKYFSFDIPWSQQRPKKRMLNVAIFWDLVPCNAERWFLGGLIFDPEEGGDTFLRNIGLRMTTRRYIPEDGNIHNYRCENLKSWSFLSRIPVSTNNTSVPRNIWLTGKVPFDHCAYVTSRMQTVLKRPWRDLQKYAVVEIAHRDIFAGKTTSGRYWEIVEDNFHSFPKGTFIHADRSGRAI
jgi:hypothetical protein